MGCICKLINKPKKNNIIERGIPQAIIIDSKEIDISNEKQLIIKEQKENSICIINGPKKGTGFFCSIPYSKSKNNHLHVLITCNHVLDENIINQEEKINLLFEDKSLEKTLKFEKERKKYFNEEFDITIIEIKEEDNLDFVNFLEIDNKILREGNLEKIYIKEIFYIIDYPQAIFSTCHFGKIKNIYNNKILNHDIQTQYGSSGAPILNLQNNKIIGLHRGYDPNTKLNRGSILTEPLIEFDKDIKTIIKDKIDLTLEVNENDVNKDIYFLDNSFFNYENALNKSHSFLSELNDSNVKVYINKKKLNQYQKYFRPEAKGLYYIRLEINIKLKFCQNMFEFCKNIKEIDLSDFDTSKVVDMSYMFKDCDKLEQLNLSYFSTEKVNNMDYMFYNCNSLNKINLSFFDTKNVIHMENMFSKCNKLEDLDLSHFNTENVINMKNMFSDCSYLKNLDLTSFDTKNVTDMSGMFLNCNKLKNVELSPSFTTNKVKNMKQMFCGCNCLININLKYFDTKNVTDMSEMFSFCNSLTYLNLTSFDTRNVLNMRMMFNKCYDLFNIDINTSIFVNDNVKDMTKMFSGCHSLKVNPFSHFHYKDKKYEKMFEDTQISWIEKTSILTFKK